HRHEREAQIRKAVADGAADADQVVAAVYTDVPAVLHPAASRSVKAVLEMLVDAGQIDPALRPTGAAPDDGDEPSTIGRDDPDG
ncbi:MAG TPA: hypothetical protein VMM13_10055, partial [Euzebya sp.]|nr:hypothetical protein [Euzebya sp.]